MLHLREHSYTRPNVTVVNGIEETIRAAEDIRSENARSTVFNEYIRLGELPSDINEHLHTLKHIASQCTSVVEMGVRTVVSTWALLAGLIGDTDDAHHTATETKRLVCVDLDACDISAPRLAAAQCGVELSFVQGDSATVVLPESDMMFIDTWHVYGHLIRELRHHSTHVRRFIAMHDTKIDGEHGESLRVGWDTHAQAIASGYLEEEIRKGLKPAITDFLASDDGVNWCIALEHTYNNGLTVLCRRANASDIELVASITSTTPPPMSVIEQPSRFLVCSSPSAPPAGAEFVAHGQKLGFYNEFTCARPLTAYLPTNSRVACVVAMEDPLLAQLLIQSAQPGLTRIAVWNTEQMSRPRILHDFVNAWRHVSAMCPSHITLEIWDFSHWNAAKLRDALGTGVRVTVYASSSATDTDALRALFLSTPKEFDFAFVGTASPRRTEAIERARARGFTVHQVDGWGLERDAQIARARALLNIHFASDYQVFESVRCVRWLAAGMPVVTEPCINNDEARFFGATVSAEVIS